MENFEDINNIPVPLPPEEISKKAPMPSQEENRADRQEVSNQEKWSAVGAIQREKNMSEGCDKFLPEYFKSIEEIKKLVFFNDDRRSTIDKL